MSRVTQETADAAVAKIAGLSGFKPLVASAFRAGVSPEVARSLARFAVGRDSSQLSTFAKIAASGFKAGISPEAARSFARFAVDLDTSRLARPS